MGRWLSGCPDGRLVAAHGGWWLEAEQLVAGGGWLVVGGRWLVAGGWWVMASRWCSFWLVAGGWWFIGPMVGGWGLGCGWWVG